MIQQANAWSCYPTAVSILTGIPVSTLYSTVGHDGSEILHFDRPDPYGRAAIVGSEMAMALIEHGWALIPVYMSFENRPMYPNFKDILAKYMDEKFIITVQSKHGYEHALAYDGSTVWDPLTGKKRDCPIEEPFVWIEILRQLKPSATL